ncbi:unnamed protein product, partial [Closterium sp. NIES-53]
VGPHVHAWGQSHHMAFQLVTAQARQVVHKLRCAASPHPSTAPASTPPLQGLLEWLHSFRTLFQQPCSACHRIIALHHPSRHLLPPVIRPLPAPASAAPAAPASADTASGGAAASHASPAAAADAGADSGAVQRGDLLVERAGMGSEEPVGVVAWHLGSEPSLVTFTFSCCCTRFTRCRFLASCLLFPHHFSSSIGRFPCHTFRSLGSLSTLCILGSLCSLCGLCGLYNLCRSSIFRVPLRHSVSSMGSIVGSRASIISISSSRGHSSRRSLNSSSDKVVSIWLALPLPVFLNHRHSSPMFHLRVRLPMPSPLILARITSHPFIPPVLCLATLTSATPTFTCQAIRHSLCLVVQHVPAILSLLLLLCLPLVRLLLFFPHFHLLHLPLRPNHSLPSNPSFHSFTYCVRLLDCATTIGPRLFPVPRHHLTRGRPLTLSWSTTAAVSRLPRPTRAAHRDLVPHHGLLLRRRHLRAAHGLAQPRVSVTRRVWLRPRQLPPPLPPLPGGGNRTVPNGVSARVHRAHAARRVRCANLRAVPPSCGRAGGEGSGGLESDARVNHHLRPHGGWGQHGGRAGSAGVVLRHGHGDGVLHPRATAAPGHPRIPVLPPPLVPPARSEARRRAHRRTRRLPAMSGAQSARRALGGEDGGVGDGERVVRHAVAPHGGTHGRRREAQRPRGRVQRADDARLAAILELRLPRSAQRRLALHPAGHGSARREEAVDLGVGGLEEEGDDVHLGDGDAAARQRHALLETLDQREQRGRQPHHRLLAVRALVVVALPPHGR